MLIPGTSSVAHLRENIAGAALALPPGAAAELDAIRAVDARAEDRFCGATVARITVIR